MSVGSGSKYGTHGQSIFVEFWSLSSFCCVFLFLPGKVIKFQGGCFVSVSLYTTFNMFFFLIFNWLILHDRQSVFEVYVLNLS